jgi:hypothetical protein
MRRNRKKWLSVVGGICAVSVPAALVGFILWGHVSQSADLAGAVPREAVGTITEIIRERGPGRYAVRPTEYLVTVRFEGAEHRALVQDISPRSVGRQARISYRVGKSGQVYVDRVEPLPPR